MSEKIEKVKAFTFPLFVANPKEARDFRRGIVQGALAGFLAGVFSALFMGPVLQRLQEIKEELRQNTSMQTIKLRRKLTKKEANYRKPTIWPTCSTCKWFIKTRKKCVLVSEKGEPTPGIIHPAYTCNLWNAGNLRLKLLAPSKLFK